MNPASPFEVPPNAHRPGHPPSTVPRHGQGSTADRVITIVLICLAPLVCLVASFWGFFSIMATASCGSECGTAVEVALPLMIFSPWVIWLVVTVWAIVRLAKRRPGVWVMLLGLAVATVIYVAANVMMFAALG